MLPQPVLERLCRIRILLQELAEKRETIDSSALAEITGISANTIRKDLCHLQGLSGSKSGYSIKDLSTSLEKNLGLGTEKKVCVVGLGRLGSAILSYPGFLPAGYLLKAGFDADINLIEIIRTDVPLFPAYQISEQTRRLEIDFGILAVPADAAQKSADRLAEGGVKGIINFTSSVIRVPENIAVRNVSFLHEFDMLSAIISRM